MTESQKDRLTEGETETEIEGQRQTDSRRIEGLEESGERGSCYDSFLLKTNTHRDDAHCIRHGLHYCAN